MIHRTISFLDDTTGNKWFFLGGGIVLILRTTLEYLFSTQADKFTVMDFFSGVLGLALLVWAFLKFKRDKT